MASSGHITGYINGVGETLEVVIRNAGLRTTATYRSSSLRILQLVDYEAAIPPDMPVAMA